MPNWKKLIVSGSNAVLNSVTASFTGSLTGALTGTSSWAQTSSRALTSSFITGSIFSSTNPSLSSSYASVAGEALTIRGNGNLLNTSMPILTDNSAGGSGTKTIYYLGGVSFNSSTKVLSGVTASWAQTSSWALTASYITGSTFNSNNPALSSSYALTASHALNGGSGGPTIFTINGNNFDANGDNLLLTGSNGLVATITDTSTNTTASFGLPTTANITLGTVTASFTGSLTGALTGTSSWAQTSSTIIANGALFGSNIPILTDASALGSSGAKTVYHIDAVSFNSNTKVLSGVTASWAQTSSVVSNASIFLIDSFSDTATVSPSPYNNALGQQVGSGNTRYYRVRITINSDLVSNPFTPGRYQIYVDFTQNGANNIWWLSTTAVPAASAPSNDAGKIFSIRPIADGGTGYYKVQAQSPVFTLNSSTTLYLFGQTITPTLNPTQFQVVYDTVNPRTCIIYKYN